MGSERHRLVDSGRGAIADDGAFQDGDELAFREIVDLAENLTRAVIFDAGIGMADQGEDSGDVGRSGVADLQLRRAVPLLSKAPDHDIC
jgi:hypothetical protein